MTGLLIIVPGLCYFLASILYANQSNWPLSIVYLGYSIGNVGLWMLDRMLVK